MGHRRGDGLVDFVGDGGLEWLIGGGDFVDSFFRDRLLERAVSKPLQRQRGAGFWFIAEVRMG